MSSQPPVILGTSTALPVEWAEDGDALRQGRVLVAPAGQHTLITQDKTIALIPSGSVPPYRPSADLLLTTLAMTAGPRVVSLDDLSGMLLALIGTPVIEPGSGGRRSSPA